MTLNCYKVEFVLVLGDKAVGNTNKMNACSASENVTYSQCMYDDIMKVVAILESCPNK